MDGVTEPGLEVQGSGFQGLRVFDCGLWGLGRRVLQCSLFTRRPPPPPGRSPTGESEHLSGSKESTQDRFASRVEQRSTRKRNI